MGRSCTVCGHKDVDEINRLLLSGTSFRDIAGQFDLSKTALARHKESHIPELLSKSNDIKEIVNADTLFGRIEEEAGFVRELRDAAQAEGDIELALKAVDRALKCIEIYAKVRGIIQDQPQISITLNSEWVELRSVIIAALEPFPAARQAVLNAIQ
jgi:hypothetical protein